MCIRDRRGRWPQPCDILLWRCGRPPRASGCTWHDLHAPPDSGRLSRSQKCTLPAIGTETLAITQVLWLTRCARPGLVMRQRLLASLVVVAVFAALPAWFLSTREGWIAIDCARASGG